METVDERLAAIQARAEAATAGPWEVHHVRLAVRYDGSVVHPFASLIMAKGGAAWPLCQFLDHRDGTLEAPGPAPNAECIAHAREDIPFLLAQLAAVTAENERLRAENQTLHEWRDSVSAAIRLIPEFNSGEWGGDKNGWGYHYEVVRWLDRQSREGRRVLADFAKSGIRCDTNPTVKMTDAEAVYRTCTELLRHADDYVRSAARAALAGVTPGGASVLTDREGGAG